MCFEDLPSYVLKDVNIGIMVMEKKEKEIRFESDRQHAV